MTTYISGFSIDWLQRELVSPLDCFKSCFGCLGLDRLLVLQGVELFGTDLAYVEVGKKVIKARQPLHSFPFNHVLGLHDHTFFDR